MTCFGREWRRWRHDETDSRTDKGNPVRKFIGRYAAKGALAAKCLVLLAGKPVSKWLGHSRSVQDECDLTPDTSDVSNDYSHPQCKPPPPAPINEQGINFPANLLAHIFRFLPGKTVAGSASLVCKGWAEVGLNDRRLWQELYAKDFGCVNMLDDGPDTDYKAKYTEEYRWRFSKVCLKKFRGLAANVCSLEIHGNCLVARSLAGVTKVWDIGTTECVKTTKGSRLMSCVQCDDRKIVGASLEGPIKVYDVETRRCVRTLKGHSHLATCIQFNESRIISGSMDRTIRVWDYDSGACLRILIGHKSAIMSMKLKGNVLVSGSNDGVVKVWDVARGECLYTLIGHGGWVSCVDFDANWIISGSHDCSIRVWDMTTGKFVKALRGHKASITCVEIAGQCVVSGAFDCKVKVWDLAKGECLRSLHGNNSYISSIKFNKNLIVSGTDSGTIRCWQIVHDEG